MDDQQLPLLLGLEVAILISIVLGGALWFSLRELNRLRKHNMTLRRERSRLKKKISASSDPSPAEGDLLSQFQAHLSQLFQTKYTNINLDEAELDELDNNGLWFQLSLKAIELEKACVDEGGFNFERYFTQLTELTEQFTQTKTEKDPEISATMAELMADSAAFNKSSGGDAEELAHMKKLYNDLLITLARSKETIKSLALRLSDIIDTGMDEDLLNGLLEDLNNSMDAFGELSGIAGSSGVDQLQDEVKEIRNAYEQGMNLMEHFENASKQAQELLEEIHAHKNVVVTNRTNYTEGETIDREMVLASNKRYENILNDSEQINVSLKKEVDSAKGIIGNFLAMTRKFQDQSTRIVILQSREKQLNSDLKQMKQAQMDAANYLKVRDIQLAALHKHFIDNDDSESVKKLVDYANEIYKVELELAANEIGDANSASRKKHTELTQKRTGLEIKIMELTGVNKG